ncbi:CpaF family protein [Bacillus altitudinis]|uniref:ATPase, T2SS/T4P/T4SS family n=1 Tax=Bacillus altitudinis TaxID=293387 RepID=UPI0013EE5AC7|nr:ATPase, T2SS/T4P/T4SS family [Bacillus altitudinis]QII23668.1 CpaF family protein [Bacillus altitudinis]
MNNAAVDERKQLVDKVRAHLRRNYPSELLKAFVDVGARRKISEKVKNDFSALNQDEVSYVVSEIVGLGIIETIVKEYEDVTDISFNGTHLDVETIMGMHRHGEMDEKDIVKIIKKFANAVGEEFSPKSPIIDATYSNLRLNAVHKDIAQYGTTIALRIVEPRLALREDNFDAFAPMDIFNLFEAIIASKSNVTISGPTGTGKTELQKLLLSHVPYKEKVIMIEDTPESHVKILYPEKNIKSWITNSSVSIEDLVKAALRNNPTWLLVSETRGQEAYEMMQGILTGHKIITTLHAVNARAIKSRYINMMKMGYQINEASMLEDLSKYLGFGAHIDKTEEDDGSTRRYQQEIVEFLPNGETLTVFRCDLTNDGLKYHYGKLSDIFFKRMMERKVPVELQDQIKARWGVYETIS